MSVGVHSGAIDLFLVGDSHRELIVAGPGATTTIAMEGTAEAGEIVISEGTLRRLSGGSRFSAKGDGFVLPWRKARTEPIGFRPRRDTDPDAEARCLPTILRRHLGGAHIESEHRMGVVAFIKFVGTDDLYAEAGADGLAEALHQLVGTVQKAADDQQVTFMASDVDENSGKIILATGLPTSSEDDERRMLRAVRAVVSADLTLAVKAGVNRGHVFVGEIGADFRSTFTLMGDTVNLAARLMAAAPAGTVYSTAAVLDPSPTLFRSEALEPFAVKGKTDLVQAYEVGEEIGRREDRTVDELPFRGRQEELAVITHAAQQAADNIGAVLDVVGEAGVGKSRLVREAVATATVPQLTLRGELDALGNPYRAMRDAGRELLGLRSDSRISMSVQLARTIDRLAPHLRPLLPLVATVCHLPVEPTPETEAIEPRFRADRTADVMIELIRLLVPGPGLVVVEDAQWMDDASAHLLHRISLAARDYGWLFVVTRRPEGTAGFRPDRALCIELGPLDDDAAAELVVDATAAAPLRPHVVEALVEQAAGNPLFLEAMLAAVRDRGGSDVPSSLDALVAAQIDALPALSRTVLRYTAVLGTSASVAVLRNLLRDDGITLGDATRRDLARFLVADGEQRVRFKTVLVREAAYASLPFRRRQRLHSRAAVILAASGRPVEEIADRLAMHHLRAHQYERAWHFARIAGEQAEQAAAHVAAALQYEHALAAASRLDDVDHTDLIDVWTRLGDVRVAAGLFELGLNAYTKAAQLARHAPVARAELLLKRARAQERAGKFSDALRTTARIRTLTGEDDHAPGIAARALAFRSVVRCAQERPADTLKLARAAAARAESCGEKEGLAQALIMIDWANRVLGYNDDEPHAHRALALYEELGDLNGQAMVHGNLGFESYFTGEWDISLEHHRWAEVAYRRTGDTVQAALAAASIGEIRVSQGRFEDALAHLTVAARTMRASGFIDGATFAELNIARVRLGQGRIEEAAELLDAVIAEVGELGLTSSLLEAEIYRAECEILLGRPAEGLRRLTRAKIAAGTEAVLFEATLARVDALGLAASGQPDLARSRLDEGLGIAREQGLVYELALLLTGREQITAEIDLTERAEAVELLARLGAEPPAHLQPA
ncbi:MAG: AAA family ATPase [Acidimicrobiia bacterium]|nr:AAA family ATPase [Acidimicrobiia bacterium]